MSGAYRVIGHKRVFGVAPGDVSDFDFEDVTPGAIEALIAAGHIDHAKSDAAKGSAVRKKALPARAADDTETEVDAS